MAPRSPSRTARTVAIVVCTVVAVLVGRGLVEGRAALRQAESLDAAGDVDGAIAHAMRAAKWYVPLASHPARAYDLLRIVARRAEAAGDVDTALVAWQAIRGAARATRSVVVPYADRLAEADRQIAVLLASKPPPGIDRDKPRDVIVAEHRALLARDDAPKSGAVVAMYAGLAVWLFGALRLGAAVERPSHGDGKRRAITAATLAVVGIVTFLIAVARA